MNAPINANRSATVDATSLSTPAAESAQSGPRIATDAVKGTLQRMMSTAGSTTTAGTDSSADSAEIRKGMREMTKSLREFREAHVVAAQIASGKKNVTDANGNLVGEDSDSNAGNAGQEGDAAGPVGRSTPAARGAQQSKITDEACVMALGRNMDKIPDFVKKEDLEGLSKNASLPSDLRAAFAHLKDNPQLFDRMELAAGSGGSDGTMSKGDIQAFAARPEFVAASQQMARTYVNNYVPSDAANANVSRKMTESDANRELYLYSDSLPANITREELQKIVNGQGEKKCPAQLQAAAQFMLDNPGAFNKLAPSGTVSRGELQDRAISQVNLTTDEMSALKTLQAHRDVFLKDGFITRDSLSKLANDPKASVDDKKAAHKLLESPLLFGMIENASAGHTSGTGVNVNDGIIGGIDLDAIAQKLTAANKTPPPKPETPKSADTRTQSTDAKKGTDAKSEGAAPVGKHADTRTQSTGGKSAAPAPAPDAKRADPAQEARKSEALAAMRQGWRDNPDIKANDETCVMALGRNMDKLPDFVKKEDLERLSKDASLPSDLRAAFAHLKDNPQLFDRMERAAGIGDSDGTMSKGDIQAFAARPEFAAASQQMAKTYAANYVPSDAANADAAPRKMTESDANRELYLYSDSLPANLNREELQKIVNGQGEKKCPAQLQAAAQFMLDNPGAFNKMAPSGTVSRGELQDRAISQVNLTTDEMSALKTLQANRDVFLKDGGATRESLSKLADDPNASSEVKKAAKQLLQSPVLFGMLDNAFSGHTSTSGVCAHDGIIGGIDLDAIVGKLTAANKKPPPKLEAPKNADTPAPGTMKSEALAAMKQGWMDNPATKTNDIDCMMALGRNLDKVPEPTTKADLDRLSKDTSLPADLRAAFAHLRDNPQLFDRMEIAAGIGGVDGILGKVDIQAFAAQPVFTAASHKMAQAYVDNYVPSDAANADAAPRKMTESDANRELYLYSDSLPTSITRDELLKIVEGRSDKKCPAQLQAAAKFMLENPDAFNKLAPGGSVSRGELQDRAATQVNLTTDEMSALNTLQANRSVFERDGFITRESLAKLVNDESVSSDVKKAAMQLLQSPVLFGMLENAANGHTATSAANANDGKIGGVDLDAIVGKLTEANKTPPPKPEVAKSPDTQMQTTVAKGQRTSSVSVQANPPIETAQSKALAAMKQGCQDDPAIKAVDIYVPPPPPPPPPEEHHRGLRGLLRRALNVVGKVLDVVKTACDVAAGFLPPPLSGIVTAVGAGVATVNNMAVKAPAAIMGGATRREAYAQAGKTLAMDMASSATGLIPGGGVAKAGASIAKGAGVGVAKEGGEALIKQAAQTAVKEGAQEGLEAGAKAGAKEGMETGAKAGAKEGTSGAAEVNTKQVVKDTAKDTTKEVATEQAQDQLLMAATNEYNARQQKPAVGQAGAPASGAAPAPGGDAPAPGGAAPAEGGAKLRFNAAAGILAQIKADQERELKEQEERNEEEDKELEAAAAKAKAR